MADLLHPPHIQLDMRALGRQRVQFPCGAPGQEAPQIRLRVRSRHALEPGQVRRHGQPQQINTNNKITRTSGRYDSSSHTRPASTATARA